MRWMSLLLWMLVLSVHLPAQDEKPPVGGTELEGGAPPPPLEKLIEIKEVEVIPTDKGYKFVVSGITKYPDKTVAEVNIRFLEQPISSVQVELRKGIFKAVFEPDLWGEKKFYAGQYEFEVSVNPNLQMFRVRKKMKELGIFRSDYHNAFRYVGTRMISARQQKEVKEHFIKVVTEAYRLLSELEKGLKKGRWKVYYTMKKTKDGVPYKSYRYWRYSRKRKKREFDKTRWRKDRRDPALKEMYEFYIGERFQSRQWYDWLWGWTDRLAQLKRVHERYARHYVAPRYPEEHSLFSHIILEMLSFSHNETAEFYRDLKEMAAERCELSKAQEHRRVQKVVKMSPDNLPPTTLTSIKRNLKKIEVRLDLKGEWEKILKKAKELEKEQKEEKKK